MNSCLVINRIYCTMVTKGWWRTLLFSNSYWERERGCSNWKKKPWLKETKRVPFISNAEDDPATVKVHCQFQSFEHVPESEPYWYCFGWTYINPIYFNGEKKIHRCFVFLLTSGGPGVECVWQQCWNFCPYCLFKGRRKRRGCWSCSQQVPHFLLCIKSLPRERRRFLHSSPRNADIRFQDFAHPYIELPWWRKEQWKKKARKQIALLAACLKGLVEKEAGSLLPMHASTHTHCNHGCLPMNKNVGRLASNEKKAPASSKLWGGSRQSCLRSLLFECQVQGVLKARHPAPV